MSEEQKPEVYTPSDFKKNSQEAVTGTNQVKIANNTLKDINEVLKTVDSITKNLGFSLQDILKAKQQAPTGNAQKIEAGVDKALNEIHKQEIASNPTPIQQAVIKEGRIEFDAPKACIDIMEAVKKIDDNATGTEIKQLIGAYNEAGMLEMQLEKLVKQYVRVSYE